MASPLVCDGPVPLDADALFLAAFEACTLTRAEWTHEAHVRMAWLYSRREPSRAHALEKMRTGIQRLNAALGTDPVLYHETVTCAFGSIVHGRAMRPDAPASWRVFRGANPDLVDAQSPILHRYYRPETLASDAARRVFLQPELGVF